MRAVAILLCTVGCAPSGRSLQESGTTAVAAVPAYEPALDPAVAPSWTQALRAYVTEECTTPSGYKLNTKSSWGAAPTSHVVNAGAGIAVAQGCGLVYYEVFAAEYIAVFARDVCSLRDNEKVNEECAKRFIDMFFARLGQRYDAADWSAVDRHCRAYPIECNDALKIERQTCGAHNAGVRAWYMATSQLAAAQARYQAAHAAEAEARQQELAQQRSAERRRTFFQALSNIAGAMAPPPSVICKSNTMGYTTTTTCR